MVETLAKDKPTEVPARFSTSLGQQWLAGVYQGRWWTWLLLPAAWLFRALTTLRRYYLLRRRSEPRPRVPIVVVGNITLGGTGKTPLLIALTQKLKSEGWRPGIISRGYGGRASNYPLQVTATSDSNEAGDEPVLIAMETGCPVVVGPDRLAAAQFLLAQTDCDVILSDDGLQHYRLPRDLEIVVIDAARGLGNGQCVPAGPLREPPSRLKAVQWVVVNGQAESVLPAEVAALASEQVVSMVLQPHGWQQVSATGQAGSPISTHSLPQMPPMGGEVHAVAGIGNPQRFFQTLTQLGLRVKAHSFSDHFPYTEQDLDFGDDLPVVMTAKDAVKCRRFARPGWWYLSVTAQLADGFYGDLITRLQQLAGNDRAEG